VRLTGVPDNGMWNTRGEPRGRRRCPRRYRRYLCDALCLREMINLRMALETDGGYRCPSTPVQAGRRTTRRRTVGRSHSMRWERASGGQKAKMSVTSLGQVSSKARKRAPEQHRGGHTTPQGGTGTQGQNPPQGGGQQAPTAGGGPPTAGRGGPRGAQHRGGHQHTRGPLPPANRIIHYSRLGDLLRLMCHEVGRGRSHTRTSG